MAALNAAESEPDAVLTASESSELAPTLCADESNTINSSPSRR